ncbi:MULTISPECIES: serine/threonine protein kinase [unclassified Rothia (in: high G+C Gram-positive bacteria)]|uniref:serine/threonine protein kinase n=1 Tax=unclassified Rothia (in: high G+C Gram-positive bacteria) TaxID=2689056 RepID=UPI000A8264A0|nr:MULTISPECIES: serine/threonine protein kinase [unclassified Rothia (in: high G+C Gram-positive bacteria)]
MSQQIPVGSVLGGRYEITAHIIITAESDMVLEGTDQILNRKVSVVVASPSRSALLEANSRALATNARGNIQILDLGITPEGSRYLVTSHTRPDTLLDTLLVENHALSNAEDALGTEIFGDSESGSSPNTYEKVSTSTANQESITAAKNWNASDGTAITAYSEPTSIYEDDEDDEDEEDGSRGTWAVALAAVLLLVIVAGGILTSLGAIGSNQAAGPHTPKTSASASESAEASANASASPTAKASNAPAKIASVARFAPSDTTFMSDMDTLIPNLTDGNANTAWISYGFGTANYAGTIKEFGLALKLQTPTVVSKLTIQQNTGTGGSFTVYTNSSASLNGAVEVGKGTFEGKDAVVTLDTSKQSAEKGAYVIIVVNELPRLSLPIGNWSYGLRINEIKVD